MQFGPAFSQPLVGSTVSSTARGPDMSFNAIKPEIGAPGASISAEVATGTLRTPFGGTSGASPMVAGAAALLQQACRVQVLAMSTGRPLKRITDNVAANTKAEFDAGGSYAEPHFAALKRLLDADDPGYAA